MAIAAHDTREDKLKWLMRPVEWAYSVTFFSASFGFVYWYFGIWDANYIVLALCGSFAVTTGLLVWAIARLTNAARGRW